MNQADSEKVNMVLTNWGMDLATWIFNHNPPTLEALPKSPIPGGRNLLLSDEKGNLNIVKTDDFNSYLTNVNTALTKFSTEFGPPLAALPIPDGKNLILSDQINTALTKWSNDFNDWIAKQDILCNNRGRYISVFGASGYCMDCSENTTGTFCDKCIQGTQCDHPYKDLCPYPARCV